MNRNCIRGKAALCASVVMLVAAAAEAQQQQQIGALMTNMAANARQIKQYTFKQRTETYYKGELKNARIDEIHYDSGGQRVSIPLDEQKAQSPPRRRGPGSRIIAKKIESEQEKTKDYIDRMLSLTSKYLSSDPERLKSAMANAEVTLGGGSGQVRITMRNYVKPGDTMTMSFDSAAKRPTKTEVNTALDDDPVSILLAFDQIRDGPNYPGRTVVRSDAKEIEVRVFTYDYKL